MANNIGTFFKSEPDRELAINEVEQHLRNFWEPRMRAEIIECVENGDNQLLDIVAEAVRRLKR